MNILEQLDAWPRKYHIAVCILLALAVISLDYWTGFGYRMKIFYLMPVSYATWYIGTTNGVAFSTLVVLAMLYSGAASGTKGNFPGGIWHAAISSAFFAIAIALLSKLRSVMQQRAVLMTKLQNALNAVKELSGILPICANCKKIRDDEGYWHDVEVYIGRHTNVEFTHGICAECANKLYPSLFDKLGK